MGIISTVSARFYSVATAFSRRMDALILSCSGQGAGAAIEASIRIGYYCAIFAGFALGTLFGFYLCKSGSGVLVVLAAFLLAIHPAWTVSATGGDCGASKVIMSGVVTIVLLAWSCSKHSIPGARHVVLRADYLIISTMPRKPPKPAPDDNQNAAALVRAVTGTGKTKGDSLLGSPRLKKMFREAKAREKGKK